MPGAYAASPVKTDNLNLINLFRNAKKPKPRLRMLPAACLYNDKLP